MLSEITCHFDCIPDNLDTRGAYWWSFLRAHTNEGYVVGAESLEKGSSKPFQAKGRVFPCYRMGDDLARKCTLIQIKSGREWVDVLVSSWTSALNPRTSLDLSKRWLALARSGTEEVYWIACLRYMDTVLRYTCDEAKNHARYLLLKMCGRGRGKNI